MPSSNELPVSTRIEFTRKTRSRQKFVVTFLVFHLLITLLAFPTAGHTGDSLLGAFYAHYLVSISIPTTFFMPFISGSIKSGSAFFACLLICGVINAWLFSAGFHHVIYRSSGRGEESGDCVQSYADFPNNLK